jgi:hypothetical protein
VRSTQRSLVLRHRITELHGSNSRDFPGFFGPVPTSARPAFEPKSGAAITSCTFFTTIVPRFERDPVRRRARATTVPAAANVDYYLADS